MAGRPTGYYKVCPHVSKSVKLDIPPLLLSNQAMPKLTVTEGPSAGQTFDLDGDVLFLGRSTKCDVQIPDPGVSRVHLKIFRIMGAYFIEDLKSSNGTSVNGEILRPGEGLQIDPGDIISLGKDTRVLVEEIPAGREFFQKQGAIPDLDDFSHHPVTEPPGEKRSRSLSQLKLISSVAGFLTYTAELDEFIEKMLNGLIDSLPRVDRAAVFLSKAKDGDVELFAGRAKSNGDYPAVDYDKDLVRRTLEEGKPLFLAGDSIRKLSDLPTDKRTSQIKSVACFPIAGSSGTYGVLYLDGIREPHAIRQEDLPVIQTLTNHAAAALINHQLAAYISSTSSPDDHDPGLASIHVEQEEEDETLTDLDLSYRRKPSFISFLPTYFFCYLASFLLIYSSSDLTRWVNDQMFSLLRTTPPHTPLGMGYGVILSIPFILFGLRRILWNMMTWYEVDTDGVHLFTGILTRKDYHLAFHEFDDVSFNQNLLEAPFKIGTLILKSRTLGECGMRGVHDVKNLVDLIRLKKSKHPGPEGPALG